MILGRNMPNIWFPKCEFLQSKKSSEEITQYIQSYKGFVDIMVMYNSNFFLKFLDYL